MDVIDPRLEDYLERMTSPHEDLLAELSEETRSTLGMEQMLTGPVAGRFLELLVWFGRPERVLEIGTFSGHSALAMAAALPEGGRIDACELDPERADLHRIVSRHELAQLGRVTESVLKRVRTAVDRASRMR